MKKLLIVCALLALPYAMAEAGIKEQLTQTANGLFKTYCPSKCLEIDISVQSKTSLTRSYAEPGFEELGGGASRSTKVTGVKVHILADKTLTKKTKNFLKSSLAYHAKKHGTPIEVEYTLVTAPQKAVERAENRALMSNGLLGLGLIALLFFVGLALVRRKNKVAFRPIPLKDEVEQKTKIAAAPPVSQTPYENVHPPSMAFHDVSLSMLVSEHVETVKRILSRWSSTRDGFSKAVQILSQLSPSLRDELKHVVGEKSKDQLRQEFIKTASISGEQSNQIISELKREVDFESLLNTAELKEDSSLHFLEPFNAIKIVHLIKEEDPLNKAMVLIQMDINKRSDVFNALPSAEQKKVALELGRLTTFHWKQLKSLSRRLADRAARMANVDIKETSGFDALVNLIEHNSDPEQFISDMRQTDLKLGARLGNSVVSLELVEWLEDDEMSLFLSQFTRDELVQLLSERLAPLKEMILSKLSKQMVEYINFNLDPEYQSKIPAKKLKEAQSKAYRVLKKMFQEEKLNFQEVTQRKSLWQDPSLYSDDSKETIKPKRVET